MSGRLAGWGPDLGVGLAVAGFGLFEAWTTFEDFAGPYPYLLGAGMGLAVGLSRRAPAWALLTVWLLGGVQVLTSISVMVVQLGVVAVAFGTARWGRPATVVAAGLSIPVGMAVAFVYVANRGFGALSQLGLRDWYYDGSVAVLAVGVALAGPLLIPWLVGLVLRVVARSQAAREAQQVAEERRAEAEEVARLRQRQTDLARDVHDVVGHSLAVILAQAESAQYRDGADTEALQRTLRTIATSARSSLRDVRQVLSATDDGVTAPPGGLDQLVEGVRSGGHEVLAVEAGRPRPMPPELDQVAYRVLQEMLTNALRHGRRDRPLEVERSWGEDDLRLSVRNEVGDEDQPAPGGQGGQGVDGMRRRLESVGGRLVVRREGETFTATAWVPLRPGARR